MIAKNIVERTESQVKSFVGKVALVTNSSRGIGAAIVKSLASHGADVVVNYHSSPEAAEAVAEECRSLGVRAICVQADISKPEPIADLFKAAIDEFGAIDIVMSNSGIEHFDDIPDAKGEDIDKVFDINVKGQFLVAQQAFARVRDDGRVLSMSSVSAGVPRHAIYAASKAAIQGMVKCLAVDFGPRNITVNCIAPGGIKSDMFFESAKDYIPGGEKLTSEELDARVSTMSPLRRPGVPEDVAGLVSLIMSPEAQWMTGQTFHCSGGPHMGTA